MHAGAVWWRERRRVGRAEVPGEADSEGSGGGGCRCAVGLAWGPSSELAGRWERDGSKRRNRVAGSWEDTERTRPVVSLRMGK